MEHYQEILDILSKGICRFYSRFPASEQSSDFPPTLSLECHDEMMHEAVLQVYGECDYVLDKKKIHLVPGDCCMIYPGVVHQRGVDVHNGLCIQMWVYFMGNVTFISILQFQPGGVVSNISRLTIPREYRSMMDYLMMSLDSQTDDMRIRTFLQLVIQEIARILKNNLGQSNLSTSERIANVLQYYITKSHGVGCTQEYLARVAKCGTSNLSHIFKKVTGMTIRAFIDTVRLQYVEILVNRGYNQKMIASELGFSNASAFWLWKTRLAKRNN